MKNKIVLMILMFVVVMFFAGLMTGCTVLNKKQALLVRTTLEHNKKAFEQIEKKEEVNVKIRINETQTAIDLIDEKINKEKK